MSKDKEKPIQAIHVRDHDGSRVRIWTNAMADLGQFEIVSRKDAEAYLKLNAQLSMFPVRVHTCQSYAECDKTCLYMDRTETLDEVL